MDQSLSRKEDSPDDPISSLQKEVANLEAEFEELKKEVGAFEGEIYRRLNRQIVRIQELAALYKKQKKEKKAKRLEQKKRGKNYKEPKQLKLQKNLKEKEAPLNEDEQKELKRLYREAVVQFHPDKVSPAAEESEIDKATSVTAQLNGIYKRGDLEELINFYQAIISGSEVAEKPLSVEGLVDSKVRLASLKKKKKAMEVQLEQIKNAYSYTVLKSYENPLSFIDELRVQFEARIVQLEKRTRK